MNRVQRLNETLKKKLAEILTEEIPFKYYLITINYINCASDTSQIKIGVSVLPEKFTGEAMKELEKNTKKIAELIKSKSELKRVPRLKWEVDRSQRELFEIEEKLK